MISQLKDSSELFRRAQNIDALVFDVDGVFSKGEIVYLNQGDESKQFDAHDGFAIKLAREAGLKTAIISASTSSAIQRRADWLKIDHVFIGRYDKANAYNELLKLLQVSSENVCYIGDDIADIPVLRQVGLAVAVPNASLQTKQAAHALTRRSGGMGVVRETMEFILNAQNKLDSALEHLLATLSDVS